MTAKNTKVYKNLKKTLAEKFVKALGRASGCPVKDQMRHIPLKQRQKLAKATVDFAEALAKTGALGISGLKGAKLEKALLKSAFLWACVKVKDISSEIWDNDLEMWRENWERKIRGKRPLPVRRTPEKKLQDLDAALKEI